MQQEPFANSTLTPRRKTGIVIANDRLLQFNFETAGLKLTVPAVGAMLALGTALSAATFVRFYGIVFLGRARSAEAAKASEVDTFSRLGMAFPLLLCLLLGALPGVIIDRLAGVVQPLIGARMAEQALLAWATIVPIAESRSSYSGLLLLGFIVLSTLLTAEIIHRFASRKIRRAPPWDCGFPITDPATQYTADSFAQPLRRVFSGVFAGRDSVDMPLPGDARPASITVRHTDRIWQMLYVPIGILVGTLSSVLNGLHFLTIRQYLSIVFATLVTLLTMVAIWA